MPIQQNTEESELRERKKQEAIDSHPLIVGASVDNYIRVWIAPEPEQEWLQAYIRKNQHNQTIPYHHWVWMLENKRPVPWYKVIHHINGDPLDNRITNLAALTNKEHGVVHGHSRIEGIPLSKEQMKVALSTERYNVPSKQESINIAKKSELKSLHEALSAQIGKKKFAARMKLIETELSTLQEIQEIIDSWLDKTVESMETRS